MEVVTTAISNRHLAGRSVVYCRALVCYNLDLQGINNSNDSEMNPKDSNIYRENLSKDWYDPVGVEYSNGV